MQDIDKLAKCNLERHYKVATFKIAACTPDYNQFLTKNLTLQIIRKEIDF